MAGLPSQFDYIAGFDLNSVDSASQSEVMQAINQIAPLSNIGGVLCFSSVGGTVWPSIAISPRFTRYLWIDTNTTPPVAKIYDGAGDTYADWTQVALPDGSVTTAKLAALAVTIDKIAVGTARYLLRTNLAGTAVEFINPNAIFTNGDVGVDALSIAGAPASLCVLKKSAAGVNSWANPSFADFPAGSQLALANLSPSGTNGYVIATVGGVVVWATVKDQIANGDLGIAKLDGSTAAALQVLRKNVGNTALEWGTPVLSKGDTPIDDASLLSISLPNGAAAKKDYAHGLATQPRYVRAVLRNVTAEQNYIANDEIELGNVYTSVADGRPVFSVVADALNITVITNSSATRTILNRTTGTQVALTDANWRIRIYAMA